MASARQVVSTLRTFISCTYSPCASPEPQISDSLIADVLQPYHLREGSSPEVEDRRSGRPTARTRGLIFFGGNSCLHLPPPHSPSMWGSFALEPPVQWGASSRENRPHIENESPRKRADR